MKAKKMLAAITLAVMMGLPMAAQADSGITLGLEWTGTSARVATESGDYGRIDMVGRFAWVEVPGESVLYADGVAVATFSGPDVASVGVPLGTRVLELAPGVAEDTAAGEGQDLNAPASVAAADAEMPHLVDADMASAPVSAPLLPMGVWIQ